MGLANPGLMNRILVCAFFPRSLLSARLDSGTTRVDGITAALVVVDWPGVLPLPPVGRTGWPIGLGRICCPLPGAANKINARNADPGTRWRRVDLSCMVNPPMWKSQVDWDCPRQSHDDG